MKSKQINNLLSVGVVNSKLNSLRKIELPYLFRKDENRLPIEQLGVFTSEDVAKVIEHIINKGLRFTQLKKTVASEQVARLQQKLYKSSFLQLMIKHTLTKMGEQRRLGAGLRGFSKLLLQQIQKHCWHLILIELQLLRNQSQQKQQKLKIEQM